MNVLKRGEERPPQTPFCQIELAQNKSIRPIRHLTALTSGSGLKAVQRRNAERYCCTVRHLSLSHCAYLFATLGGRDGEILRLDGSPRATKYIPLRSPMVGRYELRTKHKHNWGWISIPPLRVVVYFFCHRQSCYSCIRPETQPIHIYRLWPSHRQVAAILRIVPKYFHLIGRDFL